MTNKNRIINISKLIIFLPVGLISGFIGGYLLSFIPNLLLFIPFILFPGTEPIREPIQAIFSNLGGIVIAINISLLLKPDFLGINKFLFVWGFITGLIILIYIPLITNLSGFESIEESKIKYTIELISLISGYSIFFKFYKK